MFVENGRFHKHPNRLRPLSKEEKEAVYLELSAQVKKLTDAGVVLTHADSHHHIHTGPFLIPIVLRVCHENGIEKIRLHRNLGKIKLYKRIVKKRFNKHLWKNGMKTTERFGSLYDALLCGVHGITEIMVHPDYDKDGLLIDRVEFKEGIPCGDALSRIEQLSGEKIDYRSI